MKIGPLCVQTEDGKDIEAQDIESSTVVGHRVSYKLRLYTYVQVTYMYRAEKLIKEKKCVLQTRIDESQLGASPPSETS